MLQQSKQVQTKQKQAMTKCLIITSDAEIWLNVGLKYRTASI